MKKILPISFSKNKRRISQSGCGRTQNPQKRFPLRQFRHLPEAEFLYKKGRSSGFRIKDSFRAFPLRQTQSVAALRPTANLPGYSGGSATVLHRFPF
jgi:hypothetical protein